ncbi:Ankyrin repeat and LEM domain-containing protein 2 [Araneus ventricosus]|uniref:Ankyrin repeat and LEM domain-containing protein 2 n=1 Tax=Araneus ventricosus TaxID=182803 RepID=A0A4Y2AW93_ARAVE|nr:Ankyrin repeat and LEM domain-containing protein 2 [Araneus ventricosus]
MNQPFYFPGPSSEVFVRRLASFDIRALTDISWESVLLFNDQASALKIVRRNKLTRFRIFTSLLDAVEYVKKPSNTKKRRRQKPKKSKRIKRKSKLKSRNYIPSRNFRLDLEPIIEDPRPWNPGDIRLLYSFIKNNDVGSFSEFIWSFPHLLYCAEALPPAEHEGAEYNLLQITVIFDAPIFCQLILDILEHPQFFKSEDDCSEKMLNNGDTPLHYASKFGFINCCRILLSHPLCETKKINDDGFIPSEVICMNSGGSRNPSFRDLQALFTDGLWYVPVFRSYRGLKPFVGKPCECKYFTAVETNSGYCSKEELQKMRTYSLKAFAGPMSSIMAFRFYTALKTPWMSSSFTSEQRNLISKIKNLEPNRGIERIGRSLAKDLNIEWKEFFPALDVFTNLASVEGMWIFEKYWESRWAHESHCGPLPSSLVDVEPKDMSLAVIRLYQAHVNPLCHRANLLYCYHKKFMKAGVEEVVEEGDTVAHGLPSPSNEFDRRRHGSDHDIYMNGSSLSELDKEVYMSLMQEFSALPYPNTAKWKMRMAAELQLESLEMGNDRNVYECDPFKPIPVPHPRNI